MNTSSANEILVIEDEPQIARLIRTVLDASGYHTTCYGEGNAGLAAAESTPPAVIVLDLSLPDMDGLDILHVLRRHPATRNIPIIIASAVPERLTAQDRLLTQAILAKPFRFDQLLYAISRLIPADRAEDPGHAEDPAVVP